MSITTDATNEYMDTFRGLPTGWVCESAARLFRQDHNLGAWLLFEDGAAFRPLIARESARRENRPCWSELVRDIWPARRGQRMVCLLTTDTKKRLWPRARVGTLGAHTPVFAYDSKLRLAHTVTVAWPDLLSALDLLEDFYTSGFSKCALRESVFAEWKTCERIGMARARVIEDWLRVLRLSPVFPLALIIAQKREENA